MADYGRLEVLVSGQLLQEFTLTKPEITIGRDPSNDVVIAHPQVSRRQARLYQDGGGWVLENLSQGNPVYRQGAPLPGPTRLLPGDQFEVGLLLLQISPPLAYGRPPGPPQTFHAAPP